MAEQIPLVLWTEDENGKLVPRKTATTMELKESGTATVVKSLAAGTITNNSDGTWSIEPTGLVFSKLYDLYVNGTLEAEWTAFKLPTQDLLYAGLLDGVTIGLVGGKIAVIGGVFASQADMTTAQEAIADLGTAVAAKAEQENMDAAEGAIDALEESVAAIQDDIVLDFADPKNIDQTKSISQNLERLDNAIESISTISEGVNIGGIRVVYSDAALDTSPSGTTLDFTPYVIDTMTSTFKDFLLAPYWKFATDSRVLIVFEFMSEADPPTAPPQVKITIDDSLTQTVTLTSDNYNGNYGVYSALINISSINNSTYHEILFQGGNADPDYQAKVKKVQILAY